MPIFEKVLESRFVDQYGAALAPSFGFVDSSAAVEVDLPGTPEQVSAAVHAVVAANKHQVAGESDDKRTIAVITRKTWLSWELATGIEITPTAQGSHVAIYVANMPGRPTALLDGKKNKKSAQKLADQIRAAL
ncbi:hypothetical protein ATJ88_3221 [Isoptericola jiangsuensis]|uniref:Uncharacterized protein n=1 Tax=Isoptericola jiangsuensis TaxID=548579 RepID=A0A2A9F126_9MICO|nr:hypothetical protein [Isoptericola jiangsuensis]PFG44496.1 hypothetical protein ATJ88_3221 [Isoptericola jiangsuensis]